MISNRRIISIIISACFAGWLWILFNKFLQAQIGNQEIHACLFKLMTGIPCPACGSTRSVLCLLNGQFTEAFFINPLGFILLPGMTLLPLWIVRDLVMRRNSFQQIYRKAEFLLQKRMIGIPAITLVIVNWAWNFFKLN